MASHEPTAPAAASADAAIGDWNVLLATARDRLRSATEPGPVTQLLPGVEAIEDPIRANLLECAKALDQLYATLLHADGQRHRLETELLAARSALVGVHADRAGTPSRERWARPGAQHDSLTSLPNPGVLRDRLDHVLSRSEPERKAFALFTLDLDGFDAINDEHGHDISDEMLRIVAARLAQTVRADDMVSALGGGEFACLLADIGGLDPLSHLACKLFDAVSAPLRIGTLQLTVRPSIGIAMCPANGITAEALLRTADTAKLHAKRQQSGYAFFDECDAAGSYHADGDADAQAGGSSDRAG